MTTKHGSFGQSSDELPERAHELIDGLHEHLDRDWSMSGGWIAVRMWDTPNYYSIVVGRVKHETRLVYCKRKEKK